MRHDKLELYPLMPSKLGPRSFLYGFFIYPEYVCHKNTENVRNDRVQK